MESLNKLNEAVKNIIDIANGINEETNSAIFTNAPMIVHQKFCAELVRVMKEQPTKTPKEVPEAMTIMTAIDVLEKCYPQLNKI